jgi:aspartate/methionine/tyrosine aminotransferase
MLTVTTSSASPIWLRAHDLWVISDEAYEDVSMTAQRT